MPRARPRRPLPGPDGRPLRGPVLRDPEPPARGMIGYYVHHHGTGHLLRALTVSPLLPGPVAGLSSLPRPDSWVGPWVQLPRDDGAATYADADVTAEGLLHWAPLDDP